MVTKAQIRKELLQKREELPENLCEELSTNTKWQLTTWEELQNRGYFYAYYPLGTELSLLPLIQGLLDTGRRVALPKTDGDNMDFYEIQDLNEVRKGQFGVMEPIGEQKVCWEDAICLTPGVGFSIDGGRIGHGAGYYDRYFERHPRLLKVGIAYEFQIVDHIPTEVTDIPLQWIVTPDRTIKTTKS